MQINIKPIIKYSNYCPENGISTVILYNPHNQKYYSGEAKLHSEDKEYDSKIFGCTLAEHRATRKMLKDELKNLLYIQKYVEQSGGFRKTKAKEELENQIQFLKDNIQNRSEKTLRDLASNRITSIKEFRKTMSNHTTKKDRIKRLVEQITNGEGE